jgi:hypothetical protein
MRPTRSAASQLSPRYVRRVPPGVLVAVFAVSGGRAWLPNLEAAGAGIASAIYGPENAVLMGISAARALGVIPRALATVVVAVPRQHRPITVSDRPAVVQFVKRDTDILDARARPHSARARACHHSRADDPRPRPSASTRRCRDRGPRRRRCALCPQRPTTDGRHRGRTAPDRVSASSRIMDRVTRWIVTNATEFQHNSGWRPNRSSATSLHTNWPFLSQRVIIDAGQHLGAGAISDREPTQDVHLPQLHRRAAFPALPRA